MKYWHNTGNKMASYRKYLAAAGVKPEINLFLVSDQQVRKRKGKTSLKRCDFTEGWVEFRDKRVAKRVAASLHNTPMGTRKRQHFYSDLWNIKVQFYPCLCLVVNVTVLNVNCFFQISLWLGHCSDQSLLMCLQYLHRFQWTHLSERLAYEQMVLQQRLRTEVSQAKRETNFYLNNVDKSAHLDKLRRKRNGKQVNSEPGSEHIVLLKI